MIVKNLFKGVFGVQQANCLAYTMRQQQTYAYLFGTQRFFAAGAQQTQAKKQAKAPKVVVEAESVTSTETASTEGAET